MRIGIVGDTHDKHVNVRRIVELLNDARVERVIHTGDFTTPETLELLAQLDAPLWGVFGNNDVDRPSLLRAAQALGMSLADPPLRLEWHGRAIAVVHDPEELTDALLNEHHLVVHGHTHRRVIERDADRLLFNPGECAGSLEGRNSVGVIDLSALHAELLWF